MPKLADWEDRLTHLITEVRKVTFAWGKLDCCMWASACVEAQTGVDLGAGVRGTYSTESGARRVLRKLGGLEALGAKVGPAVPPLMARFGDIGLVFSNGKKVAALCAGPVWLIVTSQGMLNVPLDAAINCWRTGDA